MLAKWIIRNLGYQMGYDVTFAPKITTGKAGSGLHIHMRMMKDGKNQMLADGVLSEAARKMIAGMMDLAPAITAFGNKNPTSFLPAISVSCPIRKHLQTYAGAIGTALCWCACRWAGLPMWT